MANAGFRKIGQLAPQVVDRALVKEVGKIGQLLVSKARCNCVINTINC
jgi:hypothetical protein